MTSGTTIGRYLVEEVLRVEPVGRTVRASLPGLNRRVYVQQLCPPPALAEGDRERLLHAFETESRLLAATSDPRLPRPFDADALPDGSRFLTFECPEGEGFHPLPSPPGRLAAPVCAHVAAEACAGMASVVEAGVPLYWFDPEAVFLSTGGELRFLPPLLGRLPRKLGLPQTLGAPSAYAAPEILAGEQGTQAALVYSVGAWMYEALSGGKAVTPVVLAGRIPEPLWSLNPEVSAWLDEAVQAALQADPSRRFRTLGAFREALGGSRLSRPAPLPAREQSAVMVAEAPAPPVPVETPALLRAAGWAVGLGVTGALLGWALGMLLAP